MEIMSNLILTNGHRYLLDGKSIDGLTSTIAEAGLIGGYGSEWHMDRGSKIHLATEFYDRKTLDMNTVDPQIEGYLNSWITFRKDQNYNPVEIEYQIYHPELMVASKIDRLPLLDIKSGSQEPWHILQIGFQWQTIRDFHINRFLADKPMDVYLDPDGGPPKVKVYKTSELKEAYQVYCSMLHFIRWRREKYGNPNQS
jgi:hypothetical protein